MSAGFVIWLLMIAACFAVMIWRWLRKTRANENPGIPQRREPERRYDRVRIIDMVDGTTIEGHDAVKAHFDKEMELLNEHGSSIIFQIYRINLKAKTIDALQGPKLAEIKVDGGFVSGRDTVAAVKAKLRPLIVERARAEREGSPQPALSTDEADRMSFSFSSREMQDGKLFYADHFMVLPVWVQVLLHACEIEEVKALAGELRRAGQE